MVVSVVCRHDSRVRNINLIYNLNISKTVTENDKMFVCTDSNFSRFIIMSLSTGTMH